MKICFINPPFKAEYGKFSRESRSPSIGHSGVLYYPLWLIYAAALCEKEGFDIAFIDAPAKQLDIKKTLDRVESEASDARLFVLDTSTPSIYSDIEFGALLKDRYPGTKVMLVGTHPSAIAEETMNISDKIDFVARREYDYIVLKLARAINDNSDIEYVLGLSYRDSDGKIKHNADAEHIEYLSLIHI